MTPTVDRPTERAAGPAFTTRLRLPILVFIAVAAFHIAAAWRGGPALNWHGQTSEYYNLLTDAFLTGQTSLLVLPSPELLALPDPYDPAANANLRLHDASLYRGKYYLYFGPTPVLTLFLPFRILTGTHLPSRIAVGLFCAGGFAFSCLLLALLIRREKWDCPPWLASAAVLSLGTAPAVSFLIARPSFYEVAISAGYCFVMAGFWFTARAITAESPRAVSFAAGGLCFGLAVGSRPDLALIAVAMVLLLGWRFRRDWRRALAFAAPVAVCAFTLATYNYVRFDSPFEFGISYILLAQRTDLDAHFGFHLAQIPRSLYVLLFSPAGQPPADSSVGLLWATPIALLGILAPVLYGRAAAPVRLASTRVVLRCVWMSSLATLALLTCLRFELGRYVVDFSPGMLLLAWCILTARWQTLRDQPQRVQLLFELAVAVAALYSAAIDIRICGVPGPR